MFETFVERFRVLPAGQVHGSVWLDERLVVAAGYSELAGMFAGVSFENGLYRLHDAQIAPVCTCSRGGPGQRLHGRARRQGGDRPGKRLLSLKPGPRFWQRLGPWPAGETQSR
jgi:hypothetical protein